MKTRNVLALLCVLSTVTLSAQIERNAFTATGRGVATTFVTDYHSIGINPANLARTNKYEKRVTLGFFELGVSAYSEALSRKELKESIAGFSDDFTPEQKRAFALDFANTDFSGNADVQLIGLSLDFNDKNVGGFAISVRDKIQYSSKFNTAAAAILFGGWDSQYFDQLQLDSDTGPIISNDVNLPQQTLDRVVRGISTDPQLISRLFNGSNMKQFWSREFNLSYGREIYGNDDWSLAGGIGLKYLQGISMIDLEVINNNLRAVSASSPTFGIDYGDAAINNPSRVPANTNFLPSSVGGGFGFDFGLNFLYKDKLKIGAAINDIGSITYNGNVYQSLDTLLFDIENDGVNSLNLFAEGDVFQGKDGLFQQEGIAEVKNKLPTNFRFGASYIINEKLEVGADFVMSLNDAPGTFTSPIYGVGGDYQALKWLRLSLGFSGGGDMAFRIPIGVTFEASNGKWEAGVASRDILTYLTSDNATISAAIGFLRFRFGKMVTPIEETLY
jgi:hypothetical protein